MRIKQTLVAVILFAAEMVARAAGQTVKFSFRVNNGADAFELSAGRSVSKQNFLSFHNDWSTHWANELEFGVER